VTTCHSFGRNLRVRANLAKGEDAALDGLLATFAGG
jgi:hypothetical protein